MRQNRREIAVALYAFFAVMLLLELSGTAAVTRMGQQLEIRFRIAILKKIPLLGDRYFYSRLTSDMTQRVYELRQLRGVPQLAVTAFRSTVEMLLTTVGLIWLFPAGAGLAVLTCIGIISVSFLTQSWLKEQDLRFRTHIGALSRFYLDALLGLVPIRTHRAERSVSIEHESMLVKWSEAGMAFYTTNLAATGVQTLTSTVFAIWILFSYLRSGGEAGGVLLLLYWIMKLPALGQTLAGAMQQYPMQHNRVLRLLEMRDSSEETETWYEAEEEDSSTDHTVAASMRTKTAIARSPLYREGGPLRLFVEQLRQSSVERPRTPAYQVITSVFQQAFDEIRNGADVQKALHQAAAAIEQDITDSEGYRSVPRS
ncbi:MAG: hypothetical protein D3911_16360 [Candidatus Electrothrix sp. AW3_4]|nr:hypothetical protein [Candidatus Electrothrix gigas]